MLLVEELLARDVHVLEMVEQLVVVVMEGDVEAVVDVGVEGVVAAEGVDVEGVVEVVVGEDVGVDNIALSC